MSFAWDGLRTVFQSELSFRIEIACALIVVCAGFILGLGRVEWFCVVFGLGIIFTAEFLNTSVEKTLDLFHPEEHPEIKVIKDISAAAVLIANIMAIVIGLLVFLPRILR